MIYTVENTVKLGRFATVYVDGKEVANAVMVDTDKGIAKYMPRPFRVNDAGDALVTDTISGEIHIKWTEIK